MEINPIEEKPKKRLSVVQPGQGPDSYMNNRHQPFDWRQLSPETIEKLKAQSDKAKTDVPTPRMNNRRKPLNAEEMARLASKVRQVGT